MTNTAAPAQLDAENQAWLESLTDPDYEAWIEAQYEATRVWGHTNRDSKGRFARNMETWQAEYEGTLCHDHERGITHSHAGCPEVRYQGATVAPQEVATGWLCSTCVKVQASPLDLALTTPRTWGSETCHSCEQEKGIKSFPTVHLHGYIFRDLRRCRPCRKAGVRVDHLDVEKFLA